MLTTLIFFPYHLFSRIREQELGKGFRSECYLTIMLFDKCRLKQEIRLIRCFSHITHSEAVMRTIQNCLISCVFRA